MSEKITIDTIIRALQVAVEDKMVIAPVDWINAAQRMNVLLGDEEDKLFELQQKVAKKKYDFIQSQGKKNVSEATAYIETSDEYREMKKQYALIQRVTEFIRLAKVQGRLRSEEMRGY